MLKVWIDVGIVVFVSPEATPVSRAGGMANVVGEFSAVLNESGLKVAYHSRVLEHILFTHIERG